AFAASLLALALIPDAARAQPARVFLSAQGSDGNPCTFASPCRTFQHAHGVVANNGEIDVPDPAGYGPLTITQALRIQGHAFAGLTVASGGTGITAAAGAGEAVSLNGLLIDGAHVGNFGISFTSGKFLAIENCVVRGFLLNAIDFEPVGTSKLAVANTVVADS